MITMKITFSGAIPFMFLVLLVQGGKISKKCKTCKEIAGNFKKGMDKTAKDHFGGGDTAWEESRLGSYTRSETRLLEILENVCKDSTKEPSCHAMVEEHEEQIESFWFNKHKQLSELETYLCIDTIKVCCPSGKWGKNCVDCPGGSDDPCFGHGACKGDGTRGGSGKCECNEGYKGDRCNECHEEYYYADSKTCKKCDESCESSCKNGTNKDCDECKDGYQHHEQDGCLDKNECEEDMNICEEGTYCQNTKGSHKCQDCDPACDGGCDGGGRSSCLNCATGWKLMESGKGCEDKNECEEDTDICIEGTYCQNTEGSYNCQDCDPACDGGCDGGGCSSCLNCAAGWKLMESGKGCEDVNECETADTCTVGTYCVNSEGSFKCETCHPSCDGGCTGEGPATCKECSKGYKLSDEGCVDVDECKELNLQCRRGEVCVNKIGPDGCHACHASCIECVSQDPTGCLQCQSGYFMKNNLCEDINECENKSCKIKHEKCQNIPGSYRCKCKKGYVRSKEDRKCIVKNIGKVKKNLTEEESLKQDIRDGKFITDPQLKFGALLYALFFGLIVLFFKYGRYYSIAVLVFIYGICVSYINVTYKNHHPS